MRNKKVLFLTSLLAVTALTGCGTKTIPAGPIVLPEAEQSESFENKIATYPEELLLNHRTAALVVGDTFQLEAVSQFKYAGNNLKFESKDETIATVDETGLITGVAGGVTAITVSDKNNPDFKYDVEVYVTPETAAADVSDICTKLTKYENENPVSEFVQYKMLQKSIFRRPTKQNEEDPDADFVRISYSRSDEYSVFSKKDAYLRILETDSEIRTIDGSIDYTSYDWIFHTNKYFDTLVYHQTADTKTFYSAPTQDYMDGERTAPLYDVLDNLFTVGHDYFLNQLENTQFGDATDIAVSDYSNVADKKVGSLGDGSLLVKGVLSFDQSTASLDDERNYGIPYGTPTPTLQDSTWVINDNKVVALYFYLTQEYSYGGNDYIEIMDIDYKYEQISEDRHEIHVPNRNEYVEVERLFEI